LTPTTQPGWKEVLSSVWGTELRRYAVAGAQTPEAGLQGQWLPWDHGKQKPQNPSNFQQLHPDQPGTPKFLFLPYVPELSERTKKMCWTLGVKTVKTDQDAPSEVAWYLWSGPEKTRRRNVSFMMFCAKFVIVFTLERQAEPLGDDWVNI
jgi:hypothetical protein